MKNHFGRSSEYRRLLGVCVCAATLAPPLAAATGPWSTEPEVRARLISGWAVAPPKEAELDLGIEFELTPGWHVYWKNSGDAGYAPAVDLTATKAIRDATLLYPAPHRFDLPGGLVSFGYENHVIYPISGKWLGGDEDLIRLRGRLDYLVCATECIPYSAELALDLPAGGEAADDSAIDRDAAARLAEFRIRVPRVASELPEAPQITLKLQHGVSGMSAVSGAGSLELNVEGGRFLASSPDLFFETHPLFALGRPELSIGTGGIRFRVPFHPLDETKPLPATSEFSWTLTGLSDRSGAPYAVAGHNAVLLASAPSKRLPLGMFLASIAVLSAAIWYRRRRHFTHRHFQEVP